MRKRGGKGGGHRGIQNLEMHYASHLDDTPLNEGVSPMCDTLCDYALGVGVGGVSGGHWSRKFGLFDNVSHGMPFC